jgi:hypothetical protein
MSCSHKLVALTPRNHYYHSFASCLQNLNLSLLYESPPLFDILLEVIREKQSTHTARLYERLSDIRN